MARLLDTLFAWLLRPRVRRVRRWSFVVTVPIALLVAHVFGVQQGALVVAARAAVALAIAIVAWRVGGPRGEALRDLLMHPRARAFARAELDIATALPRLLLAGPRGHRRPGVTYDRGTFGLALAIAFTPMVLAEAAAFHLLLGGGPIAWVLTGAHAYSLLWLWGYALGPRAFPHRIAGGRAVLRSGPMYRVSVPPDAITAVRTATERVGEGAMHQRDGAVLLAARGRVDVWLQLAEPVIVQRPMREPLATTCLAIASDDPDRLVALLRGQLQPAEPARRQGGFLLGALDGAALVRDAAQPA